MAVFGTETSLCFDKAIESFSTYEEWFTQFLEANEIHSDRKRAFFLAVMGPKTFTLLKDLLAPKKPGEATLEELMKALRDFYAPKRNVLNERYTFRNRKQLAGESLAEYIATLKGLAATCEFGATLEEQLRDQLVYGVANKDLRGKLLSAAYGEPVAWAKVLDIVNNNDNSRGRRTARKGRPSPATAVWGPGIHHRHVGTRSFSAGAASGWATWSGPAE